MSSLRAGDVAPSSVVLDLTPAAGVDLSTVTAAIFKVKMLDGTVADWAVTISNQTSSTLRLTHALASGDLPKGGIYGLYALLTISGGHLRSDPIAMNVKDAFAA